MAATLTINLKDNATPGLQELEQQLAQTGKATGTVATDTRALTVAQQEQIKVIHEHRAAWSQLAATVVPTLVNLGQAVGTLGLGYLQLRRNALLVAAGKQAIVSAGTRVIGVLTGTGPALAVTYGGYRALTGILDHTGKSLKQSASATDEQKAAFERLRIEAITAGQSVERFAREQGQDLEELGVTTTTNLDKVEKAAGKLGTSLARPFGEAATAAGVLLESINPIPDVLKSIDQGITAATDSVVAGLELRAKNISGTIDQIRAKAVTIGGGDGGQYLKEIEQLQELEQLHARLNTQREREAEHFHRLRDVNAQYESQRRSNAEAERLRGVNTLASIDAEISRQKDLAGQKAAALQFDERAQQAYLSRLNQLEQQRTQLVRAEAEKRKQLQQEIREETEERERRSLEMRFQNESDALRRSVDAYNDWARDVRESRTRLDDFSREYANSSQNAVLQNLITRLEAEGASEEQQHKARVALIKRENEQRIAAADTKEEREKALYSGLMRLQREEQSHQQRVIRAEVAERKKGDEETVASARQRKEELARLMKEAGVPDGSTLAGQIDPRKALQEQRGRAAAEAARRRVLNDPDNQQLREDGLTSVAASNRLKRMQEQAAKAAERDARAGAFRDFNSGNVDPRELAQAQSRSGQEMLQTMGKNGKLSGEVVQVLQQQMQSAMQQQGAINALMDRVSQLQRASTALGKNAAEQRRRAQQGSVQ